ncbi:MAG: fibronectin type III domain-containing protein [Actinomycetota bacterium]
MESAAPDEILPIPDLGVIPPYDLVGVFVPSATPYVELTWRDDNPPKLLREFRVYRVVAGAGEDVDVTPIGRTKKKRFLDYQLELGTTYIYWVTAVSKKGEESAPSNVVEVETFKDQPPEPPQGLVATAIDPGVCLDWEPGVGPNIAGYMVYLVADGGNYQPLTEKPLKDNHYYHRQGVVGYLYAVCAVNLFGTESEYVLAEATESQPTYFEENNPGVWVEGLWVSEAYPEASGGRIIVAGTKGDRLHFRFTGRQVRVISAMYWTCGSAAMYIDGQYITSVNLYSYDPLFGYITLDVPGLKYGEHTLTVEVLGTGNPEVDLYFVNVDAFEVR